MCQRFLTLPWEALPFSGVDRDGMGGSGEGEEKARKAELSVCKTKNTIKYIFKKSIFTSRKVKWSRHWTLGSILLETERLDVFT